MTTSGCLVLSVFFRRHCDFLIVHPFCQGLLTNASLHYSVFFMFFLSFEFLFQHPLVSQISYCALLLLMFFYSSFLWWSNPLHVLTQEKKNYYKPTMIQPQRVCQNFSKDSTISFRNFSDAPHILTLIHTFTTDVLFINKNCSIIFLRQHSQSQNSIWRIKLKAAL